MRLLASCAVSLIFAFLVDFITKPAGLAVMGQFHFLGVLVLAATYAVPVYLYLFTGEFDEIRPRQINIKHLSLSGLLGAAMILVGMIPVGFKNTINVPMIMFVWLLLTGIWYQKFIEPKSGE